MRVTDSENNSYGVRTTLALSLLPSVAGRQENPPKKIGVDTEEERKTMKLRTATTITLLAAASWVGAACNSTGNLVGPGSSPSSGGLGGTSASGGQAGGPAGGSASVSLSLAVPAGTGALASLSGPALFDLVLSDPQNTLTITRVALVLREIELKRQEDRTCTSDSSDESNCEEFETGPQVFELPLDGTVDQVIAISGVPVGTYDRLEFDIHKPEDNSAADMAFLAANPDFNQVSIRVEGDFNGTPFVFETDLNAEQEVALMPPLVVDSTTTSTNVTLSIKVDGWFLAADGSLIDPATAGKGGSNENLVKNNIEQSLDVFGDDNRDGRDDSTEMESGDNSGNDGSADSSGSDSSTDSSGSDSSGDSSGSDSSAA